MKKSIVSLRFLFFFLCLLQGCTSGDSAKSETTSNVTVQGADETQPKIIAFERKKIKIRDLEIGVEVADTDQKRERGLMFRTQMNEMDGMLFVFDEERPLSFWMRNTRIPLSIAYIDAKKKIFRILEMVPAADTDMRPPFYPSEGPAKYALEMNKGWFSRYKIRVGQKIDL